MSQARGNIDLKLEAVLIEQQGEVNTALLIPTNEFLQWYVCIFLLFVLLFIFVFCVVVLLLFIICVLLYYK